MEKVVQANREDASPAFEDILSRRLIRNTQCR